METLVDSGDGDPEDLGDVRVRKILPAGKAQDLTIGRAQPRDSLQNLTIL